MPQEDLVTIQRIREASRRLVRELGFMEDTLAGSKLSASGVHTLIEVAAQRAKSARELSSTLGLEKSTISRLLKRMLEDGYLLENRNDSDGRLKHLALTRKGLSAHAAISKAANERVNNALSVIDPNDISCVVQGLEQYAKALQKTGPNICQVENFSGIRLDRGYTNGLLGRVVEMHAAYYGRTVGFGQKFESKVAGDLSDFVTRLENPLNGIWTARHGNEIVGNISIDGEDLAGSVAHLRWFIVSDGSRGLGVGKRLLSEAMDFVDEKGFCETHLWTFSGLDAARHLYEQAGFELVEEKPGCQWGETVREQKFVRRSSR